MKKILAALVIVVIAGKFGLEYQYKSKLNDLIRQAAPFVQIEYGKLNIDWKGGINLRDIDIRQPGGDLKTSIGHVRLFNSNRMFLINGAKTFKEKQVPKHFEIEINDFKIDPFLFSQYSLVNPNTECRYIEAPIDYSKIIDGEINSDLKIVIENKNNQLVKIHIHSISDNMSNTILDVEFDKELIEEPSLQQKTLPIRSLFTSNQYDQDFTSKVINYCANKLNMTQKAYLDDVIGSDQYYQFLNVRFSNELKNAFKSHMAESSILDISITPRQDGINISQMMVYNPEQIIQKLKLQVRSNDTLITPLLSDSLPLSSNFEKNTTQDTQNNTSIDTTNIEPQRQEKNQVEYSRKRNFQFIQINKSELKIHIGKTIKIYRKNRSMTGELLDVSKSKLKINNRKFGGNSIMPLFLSEIQKIEVKTYE